MEPSGRNQWQPVANAARAALRVPHRGAVACRPQLVAAVHAQELVHDQPSTRVAPGPKGLEILVIGAPTLGEAWREDVDGQRDWWADE